MNKQRNKTPYADPTPLNPPSPRPELPRRIGGEWVGRLEAASSGYGPPVGKGGGSEICVCEITVFAPGSWPEARGRLDRAGGRWWSGGRCWTGRRAPARSIGGRKNVVGTRILNCDPVVCDAERIVTYKYVRSKPAQRLANESHLLTNPSLQIYRTLTPFVHKNL